MLNVCDRRKNLILQKPPSEKQGSEGGNLSISFLRLLENRAWAVFGKMDISAYQDAHFHPSSWEFRP